ncbi:MAG: hypothetical protein WAS21_19340 [Geminicoccaceae bacterium]
MSLAIACIAVAAALILGVIASPYRRSPRMPALPISPPLSQRLLHACLVAAMLLALMPVAPVAAATSPLGFTLGQTTQGDVERSLPRDRIRKVSPTQTGGSHFEIDPAAFDLDGLEKVILVFAADQRLIAVALSIEKSRLHEILTDLRSKYTADVRGANEITQHGDVLFHSGDDWVVLNIPSLSLSFTLTYVTGGQWREALTRSHEKTAQQERGKP